MNSSCNELADYSGSATAMKGCRLKRCRHVNILPKCVSCFG